MNTIVTVKRRALAANEARAEALRNRFQQSGTLVVNIISSPGSGKTTLLEATMRELAGSLRCAVLEGDVATENDADRIRACGVPAVQITTGNACHLDATMVHDAVHELNLGELDLLFIENVGNLVCPASFDLGQHRNVTLLSVPEGDDKPAKYPVMFRAADLTLITKSDLLKFIEEFKPERARDALLQIGFDGEVLELSNRGGAGFDAWLEWLRTEHAAQKDRKARGQTLQPQIQPDGAAMHGARGQLSPR